MELILKETIDTLGEEGDVVKVKPGFARNYLLPKKMAVVASKANMAMLEQEKSTITTRLDKQRQEAESLAQKINGTSVVIEQRVGEEDRLFGSVTAADIYEKLSALGIEVDKKKIMLDEPIKTLGLSKVSIKVGFQTIAEVQVEIVPLPTE